MIEVKVKISEVDYSSAMDAMLPVLLDRIAVPDNPIAAAALNKLKGLPAGAARAAVKILPRETKDELAVACVKHYNEKISQIAEEMARKNGVPVKVDGVEASVQK